MEEPSDKKIKLEFVELEDVCTAEEDVNIICTPDEVVDVEGIDPDKPPYAWNKTGIPESPGTPNQNSSENSATLLLDFAGPCNFGYHFRKDNASQMVNSWLYSEMLNQVFLKMGNVVHIQFTVDETKAPDPNDLFIRATPVFCSSDHMHLPVNRCTLHSLEDDPLNEAHSDGTCHCNDYNLVGHIIRSTSANAIYCYDDETERHSVIVPLKHRLYDLLFSFSCKTSCSRGMERRPIRTVFSLENRAGLVLGRCSLNIKICSCPKRDKDRGEKEFKISGRTVKRRFQATAEDSRNEQDEVPTREDVDPLSEQVASLEKHVNGKKTDHRISKLTNELLQVQNLVKKLNHLCSSIEQTLDSLDSDI
uniref:Cellular tumor antigen p53 n=2 Tax=Lygus hesperus TaxID=30085 RepID=A0A0A9W1L4_LYGHE